MTKLRKQLIQLLAVQGVRPVLNEIASIVENTALSTPDAILWFNPDDDHAILGPDARTIAANLRADMF